MSVDAVTVADESGKSHGEGADTDLHEGVRIAKASMPKAARHLSHLVHNHVRGAKDMISAVRLLYEIALQKVPEVAKPETRATGKLLLVTVEQANERLSALRKEQSK